MKYEYFLKNKTVDTKLSLVFIEELIKNLDEIYYKLSRRILHIKTENIYSKNGEAIQTYESTQDTKTFISDLLECTDNMQIILLKIILKKIKKISILKLL